MTEKSLLPEQKKILTEFIAKHRAKHGEVMVYPSDIPYEVHEELRKIRDNRYVFTEVTKALIDA